MQPFMKLIASITQGTRTLRAQRFFSFEEIEGSSLADTVPSFNEEDGWRIPFKTSPTGFNENTVLLRAQLNRT